MATEESEMKPGTVDPIAPMPAEGRPRGGPPWPWALAAGLLAALIGATAGEAVHGRYRPVFTQPPNWNRMSSYERDDYRSMQEIEATPAAELKNTALVYGLLGATLGGALGVAGGLSRRSAQAALGAGAAGLVLGGSAGAGAAAGAVPIFFRFLDRESSDLLLPFLTHLALFAVIGAAAGLALGLGRGGRGSAVRGLLGGMVGGIVGTVAFEAVIALGFPTERLVKPIPLNPTPRLLVHGCTAVLVALGAAVGLQVQVGTPRTTDPPKTAAG